MLILGYFLFINKIDSKKFSNPFSFLPSPKNPIVIWRGWRVEFFIFGNIKGTGN